MKPGKGGLRQREKEIWRLRKFEDQHKLLIFKTKKEVLK